MTRPAHHAIAALAAALFAPAAAAIVISEEVFTSWGGNPSDVHGTLEHAMKTPAQTSNKPQFLAVGSLEVKGRPRCTGTWIGDSPDRSRSYVLTSRQCVFQGATDLAPFDRLINFFDWRHQAIAQFQIFPGMKTVGHVNPEIRARVAARPGPSLRGASDNAQRPDADGAVVIEMVKTRDIIDMDGRPISPPILYEGRVKPGSPAWFVGYGAWGVGPTAPDVLAGLRADDLEIPARSRRAAAWTMIDAVADDRLIAQFQPQRDKRLRVRGAPGDGGAPWWQMHGGHWTIVATMGESDVRWSVGNRVSDAVDTIRRTYPQARFLSDVYTITESDGVATPNLASRVEQGDSVAYVVPPQDGVAGPTELTWTGLHDGNPVDTILTVRSRNTTSGRHAPVYLRARRLLGCDDLFVPMNNAVSCYENSAGPLAVSYDPKDNRHLEDGVYEGSFDVEARAWSHRRYSERIGMRARIAVRRQPDAEPGASAPDAAGAANAPVALP